MFDREDTHLTTQLGLLYFTACRKGYNADASSFSNSHDANQGQCKFAYGELALPLIAGLARPSGAPNPQSLSKPRITVLL
jgi:hypothetical protein